MSRVDIHLCPETGICSIIKEDAEGKKIKVDLVADEANELRDAQGDPEKIQELIADFDDDVANALDATDLKWLGDKMIHKQ